MFLLDLRHNYLNNMYSIFSCIVNILQWGCVIDFLGNCPIYIATQELINLIQNRLMLLFLIVTKLQAHIMYVWVVVCEMFFFLNYLGFSGFVNIFGKIVCSYLILITSAPPKLCRSSMICILLIILFVSMVISSNAKCMSSWVLPGWDEDNNTCNNWFAAHKQTKIFDTLIHSNIKHLTSGLYS